MTTFIITVTHHYLYSLPYQAYWQMSTEHSIKYDIITIIIITGVVSYIEPAMHADGWPYKGNLMAELSMWFLESL